MRREPMHRLRFWRERRSLSGRELAERAGISPATVVRIETGQTHARPRVARALADALKVDVGDLYASEQVAAGAP